MSRIISMLTFNIHKTSSNYRNIFYAKNKGKNLKKVIKKIIIQVIYVFFNLSQALL